MADQLDRSTGERLARVEVRLDRVESTRQRLLDAVPPATIVAIVLAAFVAMFVYLAGWFERIDQHFAAIEQRLTAIEAKLKP
jgi:hypothetical protein